MPTTSLRPKSVMLCLLLLSALLSLGQVSSITNLISTFRGLDELQSTGKSGTGANINVVYHRAEWSISPNATRSIAGTVTTYFVTTQTGVNKITFDLSGNLTFSATYQGISITTSRPSANIIELTLPVTLPINTLDSVMITYSGTPPLFSTYGEGYEEKSIAGMGYVAYTLSESYGDEDWWPCKADMQDKVDSMDFVITVPSAFMAATNGVLMSNIISGSNRVLTYKHRYPITSYLVAISVAQYNVFNRGTVNISGTNVPIEYYIYSGRGASPTTQLNAMDFCKQEMVSFSNKFGDYPFKNEKYGMYEFGWGGGIEHQTFSAMSFGSMSSWSTIAHELAHQWWGDKVTFSTWNHLWLAEGFATYCEALAAELVAGLGQNPITHRSGIKSTALSTSTTPIYLSTASVANSNTIWSAANTDAIYQRGAMVVSMLRKLAGDTKFFQACQNYLNDPVLAYKSAVTDDLKNHFAAVLGYNLDAFFTDYIYGTGNPAYDVRWGNNGTRVNIELTTQRRSASSTVAYFRTPVVLRFSNATLDTTVVIYDENGQLSFAGNGIQETRSGKRLGYRLSFIPTTVTVDPDDETLVRGQDGTSAQSTVVKDAALNNLNLALLDINILDFKGVVHDKENLLSLVIAPTREKGTITLERSENGRQFIKIGNMYPSSNTPAGIVYQFTDQQAAAARLYYYRAKIVDQDGGIKYSTTISLTQTDRMPVVKISPNPVRDLLKVTVPIEWQNGIVHINIYNSAGAVVIKEVHSTTAFNIKTSQLSAGVYQIELAGAGGQNCVVPFTVIK